MTHNDQKTTFLFRPSRRSAVTLLGLMVLGSFGAAQTHSTTPTEALRAYQTALNAGDLNAVTATYAPDAVLMSPGTPPAVGNAAIRAAYTSILGGSSFNIAFQVAESRLLSPTWALVRTTSKGTIQVKASGQTVPEGNQELFLFQRLGGNWKIARYSFSPLSGN